MDTKKTEQALPPPSENKYIIKFKKRLAGSNIPKNVIGALSILNVDMLIQKDAMGYLAFSEKEGPAIRQFADMFYQEYWSPNVEQECDKQWGHLPRILEFAKTIEGEKIPLSKKQENAVKMVWKYLAAKKYSVLINYSGTINGVIRLQEKKTERDGKFFYDRISPLFKGSGTVFFREDKDEYDLLSAIQIKNGNPLNIPADVLKKASEDDTATNAEDEDVKPQKYENANIKFN